MCICSVAGRWGGWCRGVIAWARRAECQGDLYRAAGLSLRRLSSLRERGEAVSGNDGSLRSQ